MSCLARLVLPDIAHHLTRRGNRRLPVFFDYADRHAYLDLITAAARDSATRASPGVLWTVILVPAHADGLRATLGQAHRQFTRHINFREGWSGYLF